MPETIVLPLRHMVLFNSQPAVIFSLFSQEQFVGQDLAAARNRLLRVGAWPGD